MSNDGQWSMDKPGTVTTFVDVTNDEQEAILTELRAELESEKRRADELAAHVERLSVFMRNTYDKFKDVEGLRPSMNVLIRPLRDTPTQSLAALKLEQQAKGVENFYRALMRSENIDAVTKEFICGMWLCSPVGELRNQTKEQE